MRKSAGEKNEKNEMVKNSLNKRCKSPHPLERKRERNRKRER